MNPDDRVRTLFGRINLHRSDTVVTLDVDLVLPPVTLSVAPHSRGGLSVVAWACAGADRGRLCFGWDQEQYNCAPVSVPADTTMWLPLPNRLGITAYRAAIDPASQDPAQYQAARSEWWGYDVATGGAGRGGGGMSVDR